MGLLGKSNKARNRNNHTTIVAEGTKLRGELTLDAKLHVDGRVEGSIQSKEDVSIGLSGVVEANVSARNLVICGVLKGSVECDHVEVASGGTLVGNVTSNVFVVEPGARFDGENHLRNPEKPGPAKLGAQPIPLQARLKRDASEKA